MDIRISVVIAALVSNLVSAEVFKYSNEEIPKGSIVDFGLSLISPPDGTLATVSGHLNFVQPEDDWGSISVAVIGMKPTDIPRIPEAMGIELRGSRHYCCDLDLVRAGKCNATNIDQLVFDPNLIEVFQSKTLDDGKREVGISFATHSTAFTMLVAGDCPPSKLGGSMSMSGEMFVQHSYGMLSPLDHPYLGFYTYMFGAYCFVASVWFYFNIKHRTQLMQVQQAISCVVALCCIEMFAWYSFYSNFNQTGIKATGPFSIALITSSIRRAVSRMLVVAVSMGFGVSKPSCTRLYNGSVLSYFLLVGNAKCKVVTAGVIYMILEAMLQLKQHLWKASRGAHATQPALWLVAPVTLMDSAFYWWIFVSLSETLEDLRIRRQPAKYAHMRTFAGILLASLAAVTVFSIFRIYFVELLQLKYWCWTFLLFDGFAQIVYLSVLVGIAVLWRPGPNSRSIAYAEQIAQNDFDEEFDLELKDNVTSPALGNRGAVSRFAIGEDDEDEP